MSSVNGHRTADGSPRGVQGLTFNVYIFDHESQVVVTRVDYLPLRGDNRRLGRFRLDVGRSHLAGLNVRECVRLVCWAAVVAVSDHLSLSDPGVATGAPEGATGGVVNVPLPGL
jgi:hypothetical protein